MPLPMLKIAQIKIRDKRGARMMAMMKMMRITDDMIIVTVTDQAGSPRPLMLEYMYIGSRTSSQGSQNSRVRRKSVRKSGNMEDHPLTHRPCQLSSQSYTSDSTGESLSKSKKLFVHGWHDNSSNNSSSGSAALGLAGTPTTPGTGPCSDRARAGYLWFWGMTTVPQTMTMILVALQSPDVMQFLGCKNDPNPTYCLGKASKETDHHTILLQWIAWGWLAMHWLPAL
jgi:hypothetical protein